MSHSPCSSWTAPVGALVAVLASVAAAQAADPGGAATYSPWAGFYAGAVYGAGLTLDRSSQTATRSASAWGQTSGAVLGYNFQAGRYIYGAEGDFSYHLLRPLNAGATGLSPSVDDTPQTLRLRMRVGYDLGAFFPYVAGGVASARIYETGYPFPADDSGQTREVTGLTLGAGLEWRFDAPVLGPLVLRGEYIIDAYPTTSFSVYPGQLPIRTQNIEQFFRIGLISYTDPMWRPSAASLAAGTFDWSGAYAGVLGGAQWAQPKTTLVGGPTSSMSAAGAAVGVMTGRNFMLGSFVVGYEGVLAASDTTATGSEPGVATVNYRNYFDAELRARAGYAFGRFLPYVTAGMDWGRSEETDPATNAYRGRIWSDGVMAGGGVEYAIDDRWSARVEYLIETPVGDNLTLLDAPALSLDQTRPAQTLRAGLAYYFH